jgi:DNA polymerase-1
MKELLLIDANSLIHRAFHALPPLTSDSGTPSGALYGLSSILLKTLKEQKPDYIAAAFDRPEPTFRKEMFDDYKGTRPKAPDELISQIIEARKLFETFGIRTFEKAGFEADDIIGTLARRFGTHERLSVQILTGDLDTLQLVQGEKVVVEILKKGVSETVVYDERGVQERYGLKPEFLVDYKGLVGDASDNIPGVKGVGPKTAERLLLKYGRLENIFSAKAKDDPAAQKLFPFKETALLSKELATINDHVPITVELSNLEFKSLPTENLKNYFLAWNFGSLSKRLGEDPPREKEERSETTDGKTLNALFLSSAEDINETMLRTKNFEVAWEWKPIAKELLQAERGVPSNIFDLSIAYWLLHPDADKISKEEVIKELLNKDRADDSDWRNIFALLKEKIKKNSLEKIFYEIEMPTVGVLAKMELAGIKTDATSARNVLRDLEGELKKLAEEIYQEAGAPFNINSPREVSGIIFEKLGLPPAKRKRIKSGIFSTSSETMSHLRGVKIVDLILRYREAFKMKSTYLEPIIHMTNSDGRLRTTFLQTGTATGRIASEKPNLQNIPQESLWSERIRNVFVAEGGWNLVSFDYSQLELRLLAHVSQDANLREAFAHGQDIHTMTAAEVFGIHPELITKEERRIGKTLNFGVVYGMGPRAFSATSNMNLAEAEKFIAMYFEKFPAVRIWQEKIKRSVAEKGFVENINGRKRWFPEPTNKKIASENERAAVNMIIQSLGADILKQAMIASSKFINASERFQGKARMLLTIHDELLFEIHDDILKETTASLAGIMENAEHLSIPLKVETKVGKTWGTLKTYHHEPHKLL